MDELLVGMLAQIELKEEAAEKGQLSRDATQCCRSGTFQPLGKSCYIMCELHDMI